MDEDHSGMRPRAGRQPDLTHQDGPVGAAELDGLGLPVDPDVVPPVPAHDSHGRDEY